jgi:hypothetical protein
MASRAYSDADLTVLEQHVHNDDWYAAVAEVFPDRSEAALKTKMSKIRSMLGVKGKRGAPEKDQDKMNAEAVVASQRLLAAIQEAGVYPR